MPIKVFTLYFHHFYTTQTWLGFILVVLSHGATKRNSSEWFHISSDMVSEFSAHLKTKSKWNYNVLKWNS